MSRHFYGDFALRKIPSSIQNNSTEPLTDKGIDEIKLIELSTAIDKWEQEILLSNNGFFSLKGKEPSDKIKDFSMELKYFINHKINELSLLTQDSKEKAKIIKQTKISLITQRMELYANEQLYEWEISTCEEALSTIIQKAVFYKNEPSVVALEIKNGIRVLEILSKKESWNQKLYNYRKKDFISNFYVSLITQFVKDKDVLAYQYFNQYKTLIKDDECKELENLVDKMRISITAFNWAKEIFSYNLEDSEFKRELNKIDDDDIKAETQHFYSDLKISDDKNKKIETKEKNQDNWNEIIKLAKEDINSAVLYIDHSLKNDSITAKKEYIKQIRKNGNVKTNIEEFFKLFDEIAKDYQTFKEKDISDYHAKLSSDIFTVVENIQNYSTVEFEKFYFDYQYIKKMFEKSNIKKNETKYEILVIYFISLSEYKEKKEENADIETRTKQIDAIFARFNERKGNK